MPTIDELAPATSASDTDEFIVSQAGTARSISRSQVLNGVQTQLAVPTGSLLGRISSGTGSPEVISIGPNLSFNGSTLSATATPFLIDALQSGLVPASGDLLSMSQAGTNVAVTYGQFLNGFSGLSNVNISQALVTPTGSMGSQTLASLTAKILPTSGGSLTGALSLAANPTLPTQAANKAYVDLQNSNVLSLTGGSLSGTLSLSSTPQQPLQAATKGYVDAAIAITLPATGGSLSGALLLNADPVTTLQASTKHYADLKLSRTGDTLAGVLTLAADPMLALQAATKNYVDTQFAAALPKAGGTLLGSLALAFDPTLNAQAATKQYVDQRLLRTGDTLAGALVLASDPVTSSQAATKNYVDTQSLASVSRAGSSMTGYLLLASDPALALQASTKQYVDLRVARNGDTLTGALYLAANPTAPLQAATKQYVDGQTANALTSAGGTFTGSVLLASDPLTALQATTKQYTDARVLRAGDTLTGALVLASDPISPGQAATKNYVDIQLSSTLPRTGGTLSGSLTLNADPIAASQAATKHYVDAQTSTTLSLLGGTLTGALSLLTVPTLPTQAATKQYVDTQVATALPVAGGSLSGILSLAGVPTSPLHAASKAYVDANPSSNGVINVALAPYGALLNGVADDTAAFKAAYLAAPAGSAIYVPHGTTVLQQPGSWGISLTKRVKWFVDGTTLADGTPLASAVPSGGNLAELVLPGFVVGNTSTSFSVSQGSSQATDLAVQQSAYIVSHNGGTNGAVVANARVDTIIYNSPATYIWGGIDRLIWAGIQTPVAATPAQHVGRYIQTVRQVVANGTNGLPLPQPQLWAACLEYRDATGLPSSSANAALTVEMDWFGNGLDDANSRAIQSLVIGQSNTAGAPVQVSTIIGVSLSAGSSGSAITVFKVDVPFSNAVLDTTNAAQVGSAPVIKMSAGQAIAFEGSNSCRLFYDNTTNTNGSLKWTTGSTTCVVGKGISVGWENVFATSNSIPASIAGNILFLVGASAYTLTLPAASAVAAGTGFTFSALGAGAVSITPAGTDGIDCGPVVLRTNDRYHLVSDGSSSWREVFRTNAVGPKWTAPPVLPSYTVATLPTGQTAAGQAFATNGRKPTEAAGTGTGVQVFFDGQHWISCCSGAVVAA
ncbi:hypothetical protein [Rhodopila sp.]|uniref:hypothetical protein n=1 Tax=Rhodopila sp. TaxID=2480087 RepID=UPI003D0FB250